MLRTSMVADDDERARRARLARQRDIAQDYRRFVIHDRIGAVAPRATAVTLPAEGTRPANEQAIEPDLSRLRRAVLEADGIAQVPEVRAIAERLLSAPPLRATSARTQRHIFRVLRAMASAGPRAPSSPPSEMASRRRARVEALSVVLLETRFVAMTEAVQGAILAAFERPLASTTFHRVLATTLRERAIERLPPADVVALVRLLAGPDLGSNGAPARVRVVDAAWDRQRVRFEKLLNGERYGRAADDDARASIISGHVHGVREIAILLDAVHGGHTIVVIGANGAPPLLSYGRLPVRARGGRVWSRLRSPEIIVERGWPTSGPIAEHVYEQTALAGTIAEHALFIESIERTFPVLDARDLGAQLSSDASGLVSGARFGGFVRNLLTATAQKHTGGGVLSQGYLRGGLLLPRGSPAPRAPEPHPRS